MPELGLESAGFSCCSCGEELPKLTGSPEKHNNVCCYFVEDDKFEHVSVGALLKPDWPTSVDETGQPLRTFCTRTLVAVSLHWEIQKPGNVPCYYCPSCWAQRSFHDDEHGDVVCLCEARDIGLALEDAPDDGSLLLASETSTLHDLARLSLSTGGASSMLDSSSSWTAASAASTSSFTNRQTSQDQHSQSGQQEESHLGNFQMLSNRSRRCRRVVSASAQTACFALNLVAPGSGLGLMAAVNVGLSCSMGKTVLGAVRQLLHFDSNSDGRLSLPEMRAMLVRLDQEKGRSKGRTLYVRHMLRYLIRLHEAYRRYPHVMCKELKASLNVADRAAAEKLVRKEAPKDPLLVWALYAWYQSAQQRILATAIEENPDLEVHEDELQGLGFTAGSSSGLGGQAESALGSLLEGLCA